jgi:H+/Cl- antiporter ClcA
LVLNPGKYAVAKVAALFEATVQAPLTGLSFIIEMTSRYQPMAISLLASIIADACADFLSERFLMSAAQGPTKCPQAACRRQTSEE